MPSRRPVLVGVLIGLLLAACGGGGDGDDGGAGATVELTAPAGAATSGFEPTDLQVAADAGFTVRFVNDDAGVPHNVQIFEGPTPTGEPVWAPEGDAVITGPDAVDYAVPGLAAGAYAYTCRTHPTTMVGTLTVG